LLQEESTRLKTLSLELVEERQQQLQALNEQKQLSAAHQKNAVELQAKVRGRCTDVSEAAAGAAQNTLGHVTKTKRACSMRLPQTSALPAAKLMDASFSLVVTGLISGLKRAGAQ